MSITEIAPSNRIEESNRMIARLRRERRTLESVAPAYSAQIAPLLDGLGQSTWGRSVFGARYTVLGPTVSHGGIEWSVRSGKWTGPANPTSERPHEAFKLRLAFDADLQPSYYQVSGAESLGSYDVSIEGLRSLVAKALRVGPSRVAGGAGVGILFGRFGDKSVVTAGAA